VLSVLKQELAQLVTDTGRPKAGGLLAEATTRLDSLQGDLVDAEARLSVLDGQLIELTAKRGERARLGDPALVGEMTTDLESARQDLKAGEGAAALLSQFEAAEQRSKSGLDRIERHLLDLHERRARIDGDRKRDAELREASTLLDDQEQSARGTIRHARDEIAALDAQAEREEEQERNLQRLATIAVRAAARASLARKQHGLEELEVRLVKNAAGNPRTNDSIRRAT
jgi:chromosome segregation ATPase